MAEDEDETKPKVGTFTSEMLEAIGEAKELLEEDDQTGGLPHDSGYCTETTERLEEARDILRRIVEEGAKVKIFGPGKTSQEKSVERDRDEARQRERKQHLD